jgi:hypothetical protein
MGDKINMLNKTILLKATDFKLFSGIIEENLIKVSFFLIRNLF